jgi:hypothetical protein
MRIQMIRIKMNIFSLAPSGGPPCRGGPLCIDVGLNILQQMKGIPGRPGWLYVFH